MTYEFDGFRIDLIKRRLFHNGIPVQLTPKAFDTLAVLIRRGRETVSKAELMDAVWGDTAVEENNLTQQIAAIRRALGDRVRDHRFVVTVPGRGYCFVASLLQTTEEIKSTATRSRFDSKSVFGVCVAIAYVLAVCLPILVLGGRGTAVKPQTVAILAFKTIGDGRDEPLGVGIRDTLRAKLGNLDDVAVRPANSDAESLDAVVAGQQLSADIVLTGSIQHDDARVRVAVEIVDVTHQRIVWGRTFDENSGDLFGLQDSIAGEVVQALRQQRSISKNIPLTIYNRLISRPAGMVSLS